MITKKRYTLILPVIAALLLAPPLQAETTNQQRERIERMSPAEKEELQRKEKRFRSLTDAEKKRLRDMDSQIAMAPDGPELRKVMVRYYEWLKALPPGKRAEILSLTPDERVKEIRHILEKQSTQRFQRFVRTKLDDSDVPVIKKWMEGFVDRHRNDLLVSLSPDRRREIQSNPQPEGQRWLLMNALWRGEVAVSVSPEELDILAEQLSPSARQVLQAETDPSRQSLLLRSWLEAVMFANWVRRFPPVSTEELMRFLQEEVSDREREELEKLPAEPFRREAERLYHHNQMRKRWEQMRRRGSESFPNLNPDFPERRSRDRNRPDGGD